MASLAELIMEYVQTDASFLVLVLDTEGHILNTNRYTRELVGEDIQQQTLNDILVDFTGTAKLSGLLDEPGRVHLLNVRTAGGLPQTFYFRFFHAGTEILAIGEVNSLELEALRKGLVTANNELSNLGRELQKKSAEQNRAGEKLQDALEYVENIVESLREPLVVLNSDLKILTANRSFYDTFKVTPEETIGNFIYDLGNRQWDIPKLRVLFEEILPHDTVFNGYEVEHDFLDIGRKIILLNARQIFRENIGSYIILLAMEDITERKLAENQIKSLLAEKELLLREVHHRIKNNMNVITSLLSLQADMLKDPSAIAALEDSGSRVRSMMMILYDKLYRSADFREISAKEYLTSLIDEIAINFPNRDMVTIEKQIDDIILDAKILSPAGIILNELLTNAMKHAFIGRENGKISVSLSFKDNHATLMIQDNGVGIPESIDITASTGFGMQLVGILTEQLEGSMTIEREKGTKFILEFEI
ncbi:MAG: ATP-binding protein [Proteobacteria bacterium]|nr:ATP-binding protein [Pseudomonadota bacterium]